MARLLVIGADPHRERAFARWAGMGLTVGLADGTTAAGYEHLVDHYHPVDVRRPHDDLLAIAEHYDAVTCLSEGAVLTAAWVAEQRILPGPGTVAATIARSKARQRAANQAAGVAGPRFREVTAPGDIEEFFADGPRDAVFKPVDSSASAAVLRVGDAAGALAHWPRVRALSPSRTGIIEEFLHGKEFSVEAVVSEGEVLFSSRTEKQCHPSFVELAHAVGPGPAQDALVAAVVRAWQIRSAVLHLEFKQDGARVVMVEGTVRPAGDFIPELVAAAHGRDLYADLAWLALGKPPEPAGPALAAHAGVRFVVGTGTVRRQVPPLDVLAGRPLVRIARQLAQPNRTLPPLTANWARAGYALGWADDADELDTQLRAVVADLGRRLGVAMD